MIDEQLIIANTLEWVKVVVIGCNFCPFASKPVNEGKVRFTVNSNKSREAVLEQVIRECYRLDESDDIETSLLIIPEGYEDFEDFLELLDMSEELLEDQDYEGIYQLASFHPQYLFAGSDENDPANYTNRSPYPMLHFLRESSVEKVLEFYKNPEKIPENNIRFAREKGLLFMQQLLKPGRS
ncbi:DUF1415 domain-containing protein [Pollutibacter soli]|uniref:DUF1415 domain-containing protein n=1 Tax=Pollutibacter soli TaxID=3034157 RepID=UPI003013B87D